MCHQSMIIVINQKGLLKIKPKFYLLSRAEILSVITEAYMTLTNSPGLKFYFKDDLDLY